MSRFSGRLPGLTACIGALLILTGLAIGCGSSDDESTATAGRTDSAIVDGGEDSGKASGGVDAQAPAGHTGRQVHDTEPPAPVRTKQQTDEDRQQSGRPERSQPQQVVLSGPEAGRDSANSCLGHFSRATCAAMAKPAAAPSQRIEKPSDYCAEGVEAMSRSECEALLEVQQAARGEGESVNLEACIDNPTPRCEEVLRPLLEAQRAASSNAAG